MDPICYGQSTHWLELSQNGIERAPKGWQDESVIRQFCRVENEASECKLGLFKDADFAGDQTYSQSTSGGMRCIFGDHTCVPISLACKTQTAVSHSSTEAEVLSLDARLRLEVLLALTLWDSVICVLEPLVFQAGGDSKLYTNSGLSNKNP